MLKSIVKLLVLLLVLSACEKFQQSEEERLKSEYRNIYNALIQNNNFQKFIGFHIVRRDNGNTFFYNNLNIDSSGWQSPINYDGSQSLDEQITSFFKHSPEAKFQFDMMLKYGIKAVITKNYNIEKKKLEYRESGGFNFNKYELTFFILDSISISHINFNFDNYSELIKDYYRVIEKFDSTWFALKEI
jgi:hypothetical protein